MITEPAVREKEVNEHMELLRNSIAELNQTVERLAPSLSEVLSDAPLEVDDSDKVDVSLCSLANYVRELRIEIKSMTSRIRHLLDRIEV